MISRPDALKLLASLRTNQAVITTMNAAKEWPFFSNNDDLDFPIRGCMGQGSTVGLGVALAQPGRQVWVLNGDGSQLMNLGSLASIAAAGVKNLVIFVFQNDTYETTGGQPIPLAGRLDFAAVARGLEWKVTGAFDDLASLEARLPGILKAEGPALVVLKVQRGKAPQAPKRDPIEEVQKFKRALTSKA